MKSNQGDFMRFSILDRFILRGIFYGVWASFFIIGPNPYIGVTIEGILIVDFTISICYFVFVFFKNKFHKKNEK